MLKLSGKIIFNLSADRDSLLVECSEGDNYKSYKNCTVLLINTERFKNTFINTLTCKYDFHRQM